MVKTATRGQNELTKQENRVPPSCPTAKSDSTVGSILRNIESELRTRLHVERSEDTIYDGLELTPIA